MSEYSLDEPGFTPPVPPVPPSSSESSVETPVDGCRKVPPVPGGCVRSRLTDILFVFIVRVLIAILLIVARSAWSGRWMISLNMRKSQIPNIEGVVF